MKLLWDCYEQSHHVIEHCRPDLLLVKKRTKEATIVNIAVPGDTRILNREQRRNLAHQDLKRKIKRVWQLRKVNSIVVGALGTVTPKFQRYLNTESYKLKVANIQKTGLTSDPTEGSGDMIWFFTWWQLINSITSVYYYVDISYRLLNIISLCHHMGRIFTICTIIFYISNDLRNEIGITILHGIKKIVRILTDKMRQKGKKRKRIKLKN